MPWKSDTFEEGGFARPAESGLASITNSRRGPILIVDDNVDDAAHARKVVERLHSPPPIRVLSSGEEVYAYLDGKGDYQNRTAHPYPVLLLVDLLMPGTDGFAVLKWLQAHPEHHALPVIVLSVVREFKEISRAYQLGARSFLMKPLMLDEFRTSLHAMSILPDSDLYGEPPEERKKSKTRASNAPDGADKTKRAKRASKIKPGKNLNILF